MNLKRNDPLLIAMDKTRIYQGHSKDTYENNPGNWGHSPYTPALNEQLIFCLQRQDFLVHQRSPLTSLKMDMLVGAIGFWDLIGAGLIGLLKGLFGAGNFADVIVLGFGYRISMSSTTKKFNLESSSTVPT